jgi:hypothetical protein
MIIYMDIQSSLFYFNESRRLASALGYLDIDADCNSLSRKSHTLMPHAEEKRYIFWELIQKDCCYRLMLDRSSVIPFSRPNVKLPALTYDAGGTPNADVKQL